MVLVLLLVLHVHWVTLLLALVAEAFNASYLGTGLSKRFFWYRYAA